MAYSMGIQIKFNGRNTVSYVMARIYSSSGTMGAEELARLALKDLAPKLGEGGSLTRYVTIVYSDGRLGSFSAYESQEAAKRGQQIAAELVKGQGFSESETRRDDGRRSHLRSPRLGAHDGTPPWGLAGLQD
jgi:hypothetical protein